MRGLENGQKTVRERSEYFLTVLSTESARDVKDLLMIIDTNEIPMVLLYFRC